MTTVGALATSNAVRYAVIFVCLVGFAGVAVSFAVDTDTAEPEPVPFDEATTAGIASEAQYGLEERGQVVPRAQIFYSQYQFIVGYHGVEHAIDSLQQDGHQQQFGYPVTIYVSDFSESDLSLSEEGYLETDDEQPWVDAEEAAFVIESDARTPTGHTAVPFSDQSEAEDFVSTYGGEVVDWEILQQHSFDIDDATVVRDGVTDLKQSADASVEEHRSLSDRPVSVIIGDGNASVVEEANLSVADGDLKFMETIQEGLDHAPEETTVFVSNGIYEENPTIDRSVTLAGPDATVIGNGNGSVIEINAKGVAVTGLSISGVGENTDPPEEGATEVPEHDERSNGAEGEDEVDGADENSDWDERVEAGYGHGDAGIAAVETTTVYIDDVDITTPTNGVLLRDVDTSVVENVDIDGHEQWTEGFMGVMAMRSPTVIQDSTITDGRDSIYLHRSHETVIRNNTLTDNRFGIHFMHTSDSLIADNTVFGQESAGITIMTDPAGNAVVGNDVRNATAGILPAGSRSYIAENVVVDNERGISTGASNSLYERNVVYGNDMGFRASSIRPSNRVVENDIINNDVPADPSTGPLLIWTPEGVGNYWDGAVVRPGQERYSPSDPVESGLLTTPGAVTLSASPAATTLDALRDTTPGMREGNIIDTAPLSEPVNPEIIAELEEEYDE